MKKFIFLAVILLFNLSVAKAMDEGYRKYRDPLWKQFNKLRNSELCGRREAVIAFIEGMDDQERGQLWVHLNDTDNCGKYDSVKGFYAILKANKDRECKHSYGWKGSLLHWAIARHGSDDSRLKTVMLLVAVGAECNVKRTSDQRTPLHLACENGYFDIIKLLVWGGADKLAEDWIDTTPMDDYKCYCRVMYGMDRAAKKVKQMNQFLGCNPFLENEGKKYSTILVKKTVSSLKNKQYILG